MDLAWLGNHKPSGETHHVLACSVPDAVSQATTLTLSNFTKAVDEPGT